MEEVKREPHARQRAILQSTCKYKVVAAGRRSGKTTLCEMAYNLAIEQNKTCVVVVPDNMLAAIKADTSIPGLVIFHSGSKILKKISSIDFLVIDEVSHCDYRDVSRMINVSKSAIFTGTPNGHDWFWNFYHRGLDPLHADWSSWQMPTQTNPFVDYNELLRLMRSLEVEGDLINQELDAQFIRRI